METKNITVNSNQYLFVNESVNTRSGFAHITHLFRNGGEISSSRCNYLNRTWERYTYQSSMIEAVYNLLESVSAAKARRFMADKGYKKLTAKRREELETWLDSDPGITELKALKEQL